MHQRVRIYLSVLSVIAAGVVAAPRSMVVGPDPAGYPFSAVDTVVAAPGNLNYSYGPKLEPRTLSAMRAAATTNITVDYVGFNFNPQAQAAFQAAVAIWENVLSTLNPNPGPPIRVRAFFQDLGDPGILGSAGPAALCTPALTPFPGLPNTYYAAALADRLANADVCATGNLYDIDAFFNNTFANWDFGTSGPVSGKYNFMTVVLHELAHGLGFIGSMDVQGGLGFWGDAAGFPYIFDRFAVSGGAVPLLIFPSGSSALAAQLVSNNVFFNGPSARANNGNASPKLESSLNPFDSASSFSHLDDTLYTGTPNGLMTFAIAQAEFFSDPGPIVKGILLDEGWGGPPPVQPPCTSVSIEPSSIRVPLSGVAGSVSVMAPSWCAWTAQSNAPSFIAVIGGASGAGNGTVSYSVSATTTSRTGTITIAGQTFTVSQVPLTVSPASLTFSAVSNGGTLLGATPPQSITITQSGGGAPIAWTASPDQPWLTVAPASGAGSGVVTVSIKIGAASPAPATLSATVTFTAPGAGTSPAVAVQLNVLRPEDAAPPFGAVDTPPEGQTGVTGSLAVTGWALDDFGVSRLRIFRDPVPGEGGLVFIGDAVFVKGARPDVAAAYPQYPFNDRAGWGYLLLTNFLPNQGNGTFTLRAYAEDVDGHSMPIGSRTITCTNASATNPFGAIDLPEQGATISGTSYFNFGWVLTPPPGVIPSDESTITVLIDSVPIGSPTDGGPLSARPDIQFFFAGRNYLNINNHQALKVIDTTKLSDGVHTIAWLVSDNLGRAAGIGSRFFTVANNVASTSAHAASSGAQGADGSSSLVTERVDVSSSVAAPGLGPAAAVAVIDGQPRAVGDADAIAALHASDSDVTVTHGYARDQPAVIAMPDADGVRHVHTAQMERVVIDLSAGAETGPAAYRGYTVDGHQLRALPVGSNLDPRAGVFAWAPGIAFGGAHDLVFVKTSAHGSEQIRVRVTIDAQASRAGEPQLVIDTPVENAEVGSRFTIAGWALDPTGPVNTAGIDTLHVWAYPTDDVAHASGDGLRNAPMWVGVATNGGARPDIADLFGSRFARSGYAIEARGLPPGTYNLVVYARSTASGRFTIARSVRVIVR